MYYSLAVTLHANDAAQTRMAWAAPQHLDIAEIGGTCSVVWLVPCSVIIPADVVILVQCYKENKQLWWCEFHERQPQEREMKKGDVLNVLLDLDAFVRKTMMDNHG